MYDSAMADYSRKTLKDLFGLSMNKCAFRLDDGSAACEEQLVDPRWKSVKARVCHIRARSKEGPRFEANMTDNERYAFDNLILLCPTHHVQIDDLEPERFTVEVLTKMKNDAMSGADATSVWARSTDLIDRAVERLIVVMERENRLELLPPISMSEPEVHQASGSLKATSTATGGGAFLEHEVTRVGNDEPSKNDIVTGPPAMGNTHDDSL
jgi:hypothetical protein